MAVSCRLRCCAVTAAAAEGDLRLPNPRLARSGQDRIKRRPIALPRGPEFPRAGKSEAQPPARSPPQAPRAQGVRRTGPARGSERCGRLAATPGDAPVGRLHAPEAPRTGPVSALRRYSSWSPPGRWLNGHNGHFSGQPGRDHVCQVPGPYGSGFNGPRAVLNFVPTTGDVLDKRGALGGVWSMEASFGRGLEARTVPCPPGLYSRRWGWPLARVTTTAGIQGIDGAIPQAPQAA